jgi:hypothetical protein
MLSELHQAVDMASTDQLHVQLTLFDAFGVYDQLANSAQWAEAVLAGYKNDPEIAFVELQNEIDPTNPAAMAWAQYMIPQVSSMLGTVPLTISTSGAGGIESLTLLKQALAGTPISFYDYHYYADAQLARSVLQQAQAVVAPTPLFVGETGYSTNNSAVLESEQYLYYELVDEAARSLGLGSPGAWTLNDFTAASAPSAPGPQLFFGVFDTNGLAKPAAAALEQDFTGQPFPVLSNPSFETSSGGIPTGWAPVQTQDGALTLSTTVAHTGANSVEISDTSGPNDEQPAWTQTANLGPLSAGQNVQATVWAEGADATGTSEMAIAWYDASENYLGSDQSQPLTPGTSTWTELGVDATAPAGAAYAVVSLQSYQNSGSVWFDDVNMANLGSAAFPALPAVAATSGIGPIIANPSFETSVGGIPTGWAPVQSQDGALTLSTTVAHTGANSVEISDTSGPNDEQPAWTQTANLGPLSAGQNVQATVWAEGADATGTSELAIAWFGSSENYLGSDQSQPLTPGTSTWTELGVDATAPAGAAYAVVSLQSYENSGSVWFDDVNLTNLGSAAFPALP